jgi:RND family efflux transporter MFP subunit
MHVTRKQVIAAAIALFAVIGAYFVLAGKPQPEEKKPRNPVQAITSIVAEQKAIPITIRANAHVTADNAVEVRPQTQNIVRSIHVREGQEVKAGQLLFTLDQRSGQAEVERAQAQLARNRSDLAEAENTLKRHQELLAKNFVSQAVVDTARHRVEALRSTIQGDQAAIRSSNVASGNNRITASISGRLGAIHVRPGSLVQPGGEPMVTIAQLDPIAVSFAVAERELEHIRASYPKGDAPVVAQLANGREVSGKLVFIDNAVDRQTGTIRMKARFANPERSMWPGTFVTIRLVARTLHDAVVTPAQAIVTGPSDKFVYVVQPNETVKAQAVKVLAIEKGQAAIEGVNPGARIVIEGTQNLRPGSKVKEAGVASSDNSSKEKRPSDKQAREKSG